MKLKYIIENADVIPGNPSKFNEPKKLSITEKRRLMDMVRRYHELGKALAMENSLVETAKSLSEISSLAETYACNEAQDCFEKNTIIRDFKRMKGVNEEFKKIAQECHGKVLQLNALYEDGGKILERYFSVDKPAVQEVLPNSQNVQSQRGLANALGNVQEVKPNTSNLQSQYCLPANGKIQEAQEPQKNKPTDSKKFTHKCPICGGPSEYHGACDDCTVDQAMGKIRKGVKEAHVNTSNLDSQREIPHVNGPATPQIKEGILDYLKDKAKSIGKNIYQNIEKRSGKDLRKGDDLYDTFGDPGIRDTAIHFLKLVGGNYDEAIADALETSNYMKSRNMTPHMAELVKNAASLLMAMKQRKEKQNSPADINLKGDPSLNEYTPNDKNLKGQREAPHVNGPATSQMWLQS